MATVADSFDVYEKWSPASDSQAQAVKLDVARRCAPILGYSSPRKYNFYVQDNRKVPIAKNTVLAPSHYV